MHFSVHSKLVGTLKIKTSFYFFFPPCSCGAAFHLVKIFHEKLWEFLVFTFPWNFTGVSYLFCFPCLDLEVHFCFLWVESRVFRVTRKGKYGHEKVTDGVSYGNIQITWQRKTFQLLWGNIEFSSYRTGEYMNFDRFINPFRLETGINNDHVRTTKTMS